VRLAVVMGLRKGLKLIRGMRRSLSEDDRRKIASTILEHVEQNNWKIEQGQRARDMVVSYVPVSRPAALRLSASNEATLTTAIHARWDMV
jgi:hypothetical protein